MEAEKISSKGMARVICEIWKDVEGWEGVYEVSNAGRIRKNGKILKCGVWSRYKVVRLREKERASTVYVHRLVAKSFIPNPEMKPIVNHIDGNKLNNNVCNLEWCTKQENEIHAWKHGMKEKIRITSRENVKIARLFNHSKISVTQKDMSGNVLMIWDSASDAMKETGIDGSAITKCCRGKLKQTGGYKWQYTEQRS